MRHLRIEQNNIQENVSSSVIAKLYDITSDNNNLDNSSTLAGNLYTSVAYEDHIQRLTTLYPNLTITANKYYIRFKDPEAERILKNVTYNTGGVTYTFGDGIGVFADGGFTTMPVLLPDWFSGNTTITQFEELSKAVKCNEIYANAFNGCSNLQKVDLANIENLGASCFKDCTSLTSVGNTNKLQYVGSRSFQGANLTGSIYLSSVRTLADLCFYNNPNLSLIDFGPGLANMNWQSIWSCSNNLKMIFRGSTPPTVSGNDTRLYNNSYTIYIPDGCKDAYIQEPHFAANESKIHFISELES